MSWNSITRRGMACLLAGLAMGPNLWGQPTSPPPIGAGGPGVPPRPPLPSQTPVDFFRSLLVMRPVDRVQALTNRPALVRSFLEGKLQEFEALPAPTREARLQTLQLRWLLPPLMRTAPAQRAVRLAALPAADRQLVAERLEQWDQLPGDFQQKVLENENVIRLFFRPETNLPTLGAALTNFSPAQLARLEQERDRWRALGDGEKAKVLAAFDRFFELNTKEKDRILNRMTEIERKQMEMALRLFARLPEAQRKACLRGFQKFAELTPAQQQEFLANADRWQAMSPEDRQLWRKVVAKLQPKPPLPPGLGPPTPPMPPPPSSIFPRVPPTAVATN
jgi:hypothetical protein